MDPVEVIQYMHDPALAFDDEWRVEAVNVAFEDGLYEPDHRAAIERVFGQNQALADQHADMLRHYPDVAGVVEGESVHFDPTHDTIAALHDNRDPREDDPDMGVFVDGEVHYFDLAMVDVPDTSVQILVCRDITRIKDHSGNSAEAHRL